MAKLKHVVRGKEDEAEKFKVLEWFLEKESGSMVLRCHEGGCSWRYSRDN